MFKKILPYIFSAVFFISPISEAKKTIKTTKNIVTRVTPPIQTRLVIDTKSGKVLESHNSQIRIYPASLTKLMTLHIIFDQIKKGKLALNDTITVSHKAAKMPPCKLGLKPGEIITVKDAISAIAIRSANDISVAVAEKISGSEKNFAHLMNIQAKQLGMNNTYFKNASGWHDPLQQTTARDLAKLSLALKRNHPNFYPLFAKTSFVFKGNIIQGHNRVTQNYPGAEGLKTGYTSPAGFNLITSASRNNKSLIAIVTGSKSAASRDKHMIALLDKYFDVTPSKASIKLASNNKTKNKITKTKQIKKKPIRAKPCERKLMIVRT